MKNFVEAIKMRRSYYSIGNTPIVPNQKIIEMLEDVLENVPSAFNVQSTRLVLLLGDEHVALWNIVKEILQAQVKPELFDRTRTKIDECFAAGYATILFYEDCDAVAAQKKEFPVYADKFDEYSAQTSAMHQFAIWVLLREMGFGASLQHYNPLIDRTVAEHLRINKSWRLMAQMPFGKPLSEPAPREQKVPMDKRLLIFR